MKLLTPYVLHSSSLEYLVKQPRDFHKKQVLKFALVQGVFGVLLLLFTIFFIILPKAQAFRETASTVLSHANFSNVEIKNGTFSIDIKPSIWVYSLSDSKTECFIVAVDSLGSMNKYYWDDRVEQGVVKHINGVGFMKDHLYVKNGMSIKRFQYSNIPLKNVKLTKSELYDFVTKSMDRNRLIKIGLLLLPAVFIVWALAGGVAHIVFSLTMGFVLSALVKKDAVSYGSSVKLSSGLYVGFFYILFLTVLVQSLFHYLSFSNIVGLLMVVKVLALVALVGIGYHVLNTITFVPPRVVVDSALPKVKHKLK